MAAAILVGVILGQTFMVAFWRALLLYDHLKLGWFANWRNPLAFPSEKGSDIEGATALAVIWPLTLAVILTIKIGRLGAYLGSGAWRHKVVHLPKAHALPPDELSDRRGMP